MNTSPDTIKNKAAGVLEAPATALTKTSQKPKSSTKFSAMIELFVKRGEAGLNCFEAVKHHDYVLRTTVSDLQIKYGLEFSRKWEKVPNAFGKTTDCMRYWLDKENQAKAINILGDVGVNRG